MIGVRAGKAIPQIVGTNLHITQGGVEFDAMEFDKQRNAVICRGSHLRRAGYIHLYLPEQFRPAGKDSESVRCLPVIPTEDGTDIILPL